MTAAFSRSAVSPKYSVLLHFSRKEFPRAFAARNKIRLRASKVNAVPGNFVLLTAAVRIRRLEAAYLNLLL